MQLTLREAAHLISEMSGHYIDRKSLWFQCKKGAISYKRVGIYYTILVDDAVAFANSYKGFTSGRKIRNPSEQI